MSATNPIDRGFEDGRGIAPEELDTARFMLALTAQKLAPGEAGLRWIAIALRGQRFRELVNHHHRYRPELIDDSRRMSLLALPEEWHDAWRFGFDWKPS